MLRRRIIWSISVVLMLLAIGYGIFRFWLKSDDLSTQLQQRLTEWVRYATDGSYVLSIGDLVIDPDKATLTVSDLVFKPVGDSAQSDSASRYQLRFDHLLVKNVNVTALFESNLLDLSTIAIAGGQLEIEQGIGGKGLEQTVKEKTGNNKKKKAIRALKVDSILLSQLDIVYVNRKNEKTSVRSVHLDLYNFHSDSIQPNTVNALGFKGFRLSIDSVHLDIARKKYRIKADQFILKGEKQIQAIIKNVHLRPNAKGSMEQLAGKEAEQSDIYQCSIPEIIVDGFDYQSFLEDSIIRTPMVVLKEPTLRIFNDRSRPPPTKSKIGRNPHQLIQQLPHGLDIPRVQVENGTVIYMEKNKEGTDVGKISFESIRGNAGPIRKGVKKEASLTLDLTAKLMGKASLKALFYFPPGKNGAFTVKASLQPFELAAVNPIVQPLGRVELKSGRVNRLDFTIRGNDRSANGDIVFLYEDLKVDILKEKDDGKTVKRPLISFLANKILLRTNNRKDDRHADRQLVQHPREPTKSFFNLIWKTLFEGLKKSVGVPEKDKKDT